MAMFDDRRFLLSHINHSFITGDDTGICEVVMLDEDVFENQHQRCLKLEGQDDLKPSERLDLEGKFNSCGPTRTTRNRFSTPKKQLILTVNNPKFYLFNSK